MMRIADVCGGLCMYKKRYFSFSCIKMVMDLKGIEIHTVFLYSCLQAVASWMIEHVNVQAVHGVMPESG